MNRPTALLARSFRTWALAALTLAAAACATAPETTNPRWPMASSVSAEKAGFSAQGLAALDARMKEAVDKGELSGIVTLLSRKGQVALYSSHGVQTLGAPTPMSEATLFRIYSMTKPVTAVAMMQLYEKGLWKLDDPVTKFVPELARLKVIDGVDAAGKPKLVNLKRPPTMRELMTHTAGFGYGLSSGNPVDDAFRAKAPLSAPDMKAMIDIIAGIPLLEQPGERWSYSIAVDIQGLIVERLSGQRFGDYLRANIFTPLGMSDSSFFLPETARPRLADLYQWDRQTAKLVKIPDVDGRDFFKVDHVESGGGGLVSTAHDYARFCQMMLNKGELAGRRLLQPATIALMTQNHIGGLKLYSDGTSANPGLAGTGFGFGYAVINDPVALASPQGAGTHYWSGIAGTWFWIDPANELFFIGMIQRRGGVGQSGVNFRAEATRLVYEALLPAQ